MTLIKSNWKDTDDELQQNPGPPLMIGPTECLIYNRFNDSRFQRPSAWTESISPTLHNTTHLKSHRIPGVVDNTQDYVAISTCKCNLVWHSFRYQVFTHFIVRCKHTNHHNRSSHLRNHSVYFTMKKSGLCWVTKRIFISGYFFLADGISIKSTFGQAFAVFISSIDQIPFTSQLSLNGEDGRCGDSKCVKRTLMVLFPLLHVWPKRLHIHRGKALVKIANINLSES